mmetsp:Transcript_75261/g.151313  ORF Transcript_75261/g.151313 Transcript_75261/m.151313 type:complete len:158 (-) Transcript_75261:112-585(-)|eukprot:CAMPEP_0171622560 /NCGR_PEP_ID=MMETSP0990-20121206/17330_1 /TAXON_ID=483369 /ORGANISM="non described non described, Strain CCMP2098" /LENGTH=157 /DNA_ID=CAMNT_0012188409 /DNA_START=13 /DNA_END=486 /DNA_ORIENTATION=+
MDSINNHWNSIKSSVSTFFASASDEALKNAKAAVMQVEPPEAMVVAVESASASIRETVVVAESKVKEIETEVEAAKGVFNKEISTPISKAVCEFTTFRRKYPDAIIMMGGVSTGFYPLVWKRQLFRGSCWAGVGAGTAAFIVEFFRIADKHKNDTYM